MRVQADTRPPPALANQAARRSPLPSAHAAESRRVRASRAGPDSSQNHPSPAQALHGRLRYRPRSDTCPSESSRSPVRATSAHACRTLRSKKPLDSSNAWPGSCGSDSRCREPVNPAPRDRTSHPARRQISRPGGRRLLRPQAASPRRAPLCRLPAAAAALGEECSLAGSGQAGLPPAGPAGTCG